MQTILLLGSSGFVGGHLLQAISMRDNEINKTRILRFNRTDSTFYEVNFDHVVIQIPLKNRKLNEIFMHEQINVINLMTNPRNSSFRQIQIANYETPKKVLERLISRASSLKWFQINSYFQFYFSQYKIDKDEYSRQKRLFSDYLTQVCSDLQIPLTQIYSPHLYGYHEDTRRITAQLREFAQNRIEQLKVSSGDQYLPLLDVRRFVQAILQLIYNDNSAERIYVSPETTSTLREICQLAISLRADENCRIVFSSNPERLNEFYKPIHIPDNLMLYDSPGRSTFIDYLKG